MRLTVFGATGSTGSHLVRQALERGYHVTAVVRGQHEFPMHSNLRLITADVMNPGAIQTAVADADAVLDAIGSREHGPTTVVADAAQSICKAMEATGTSRLIMVSNSAGTPGPGDEPFTRFVVKPLILRPLLRHSLIDMARAETIVRDTDLDWTIVRAPQLTDNRPQGAYRTAVDRNVMFGIRITRGDLARCMLDLIDIPQTVRTHVHVAG
ncbi:NAD(P)-dependent oxidoreductase [Nocardia amikacinitolerans]|uniref:NAD(P)-dependent oxidoreductase n=1 Tax=Nocardia amikacinitolerans TaxID=756689 RepID=UPI0020A45805|nr:NAD(P)H-binding protein [Nocardia amikacinitolerans]MCP2279498.1 putative NADH-flavin reductase [Nocardia amikacinitolerans]MCP2296705.1 putative NADH-flavin reductase [Nocardia amikacinitolerans]